MSGRPTHVRIDSAYLGPDLPVSSVHPITDVRRTDPLGPPEYLVNGRWISGYHVSPASAGQAHSTTSSPPGRSYLTGMPVSINVNDDGTVSLTVHAEDIVECVADIDTEFGEVPDDATIAADAATAGAALSATGTTAHTIHLTPKGA